MFAVMPQSRWKRWLCFCVLGGSAHLHSANAFQQVPILAVRSPTVHGRSSRDTVSLQMALSSLQRRLYDLQDAPIRGAEAVSDYLAEEIFVPVRDKLEETYKKTNIPKYSEHRVKKNVKAVLSLDGGGVRGLVTAYVLKQVEKELRNQTNIPDLKIAEAFDVIAGTSTGSLLATYFTTYCLEDDVRTVTTTNGKSVILDGTADGAIEMFKAFAKEIFGGEKKKLEVLGWKTPLPKQLPKLPKPVRGVIRGSLHSDKGLSRTLKDAFGQRDLNWLATTEKFIKGKKANVASLFVVTYDMVYRRPAVFFADRSYGHARFLTADPFSVPYGEGGFTYHVDRKGAEERMNALERNYQKYEEAHRDSKLFQKSSVGDSQVPFAKNLPLDHARYARSYDRDVNIRLDQVCRCSVAAPVYLPPGKVENFFGKNHDLVCCDGGVVANAPAQACFSAAYYSACYEFGEKFGRELKRETPRETKTIPIEDFASHMVLSIGCGQLGGESDANKVADVSMLSYLYPKSEIGNLIEVLMSTSAQISHLNLEAMFASQNAWRNYLRIQLSGNTKGEPGFIKNQKTIDALKVLDNSSDEALDMYKEVGEFLAFIYQDDIQEFVEKMLPRKKRKK